MRASDRCAGSSAVRGKKSGSTLPDSAPGYYNCRWIDRALLRRFVAMYGGRAKQPPRLCLIEALPEPLRDVRFAGGVADEWVTQMLRQGDAKVFKKYSQMKLQMKREALEKINRHANGERKGFGSVVVQEEGVLVQLWLSFGLEG
mgnify:CR=1 FL=1